MVDQFQAFLLLGVTVIFVLIVLRVIKSDRQAAQRPQRRRMEARPPQPLPSPGRRSPANYNRVPPRPDARRARVVRAIADPKQGG
jgi:hypothetical protein